MERWIALVPTPGAVLLASIRACVASCGGLSLNGFLFRRRPWKALRWVCISTARTCFLNLSDGQAVQFPLDGFPVLQAATTAEREHFAISMDRQQLFWPEIDEDVNVPALLSYRPETVRQ